MLVSAPFLNVTWHHSKLGITRHAQEIQDESGTQAKAKATPATCAGPTALLEKVQTLRPIVAGHRDRGDPKGQ